MTASKENATKALEALKEWKGSSAARTLVLEFITAAAAKLPGEAAYKKDRERRKKPTAAK